MPSSRAGTSLPSFCRIIATAPTGRRLSGQQTRVSLIFDAVVCGSDTTGLHTAVSTATLHGPSPRFIPNRPEMAFIAAHSLS
jgi:hypothetical protein